MPVAKAEENRCGNGSGSGRARRVEFLRASKPRSVPAVAEREEGVVGRLNIVAESQAEAIAKELDVFAD